MERIMDALNLPLTGQDLHQLVEDILQTDGIYLSTVPVHISGGGEFLWAPQRSRRAAVAFVRRVLKAAGKQLKTTRHSVRYGAKVKTIYIYQSI